MQRKPINLENFSVKPHHLFHNRWLLLTTGDFSENHFNTMTIGWGAIGTMWSKPFTFVAVRHSRFTFEFMEKYNTFTLAAFPENYHQALSLLGTRSGRDGDKITAAGLTPEPSSIVSAPSFVEADLIIECRKTYANDLDPGQFLDESIHKHYPHKDYHRIYYGEILKCMGSELYLAD